MALLTTGQAPEPADAIFVFAGRQARKRSGLELYRNGWAPRLILSVARFEWRRFEALGLESDGGLVDMVQATRPPERQFFVHLDGGATSCERVPVGRLGTLSEARGLARVIERDGLRKLLVVSSRAHLPRCLVSLRIFISQNVELIPVASTEDVATGMERFGAVELVKLLAYQGLAIARRLTGHPRLA